MSAEQPLVFIVEDEPDLADLCATWPRNNCGVRVAYGGHEAPDKLGDEVDAVLLDCWMPDLPGDEALSEIRDRGFECRVAMVTVVKPDLGVIVMGSDDYLVKPVLREALIETVPNLILRNAYDVGIQDLFSLASKKALLESEKDEAVPEEDKEYQRLTACLTKLRREFDETSG